MQLLLESLYDCNGFDLDNFADRWQALFENYDGYLDGAIKKNPDRWHVKCRGDTAWKAPPGY